ncbi:MAG: hypothetical protein B6D39_01145 [Anaerolineae bacterium UTCFX2]|jgi:CRISPR/Cas system-associated exonuclease Cas4 (RecB family)|nr:hypothetical protein [Anaerolineae bacterium]MCZ7553116.1 hypothetical protein [Anaerolineales bacterium]OQY94685.1 MAG: hypothetical protein B6D39_01145 [Anaerolineae bacterium UTCFX2]
MPPTIRASEITTYVYCQRAWWYKKMGVPSENIAELVSGSELHSRHGKALLGITCLQIIGYGLLLAALILVVAYFVQSIL